MREVLLCDVKGNITGTAPLEEAHRFPGKLHLAFSIFIFRKKGKELLLQKRAQHKIFGDLWSNTCCSHPNVGTKRGIEDAATTRLPEEFACFNDKSVILQVHSPIVYKKRDGNNIEHEFDWLYTGSTSDDDFALLPDRDEIDECEWRRVEQVIYDVRRKPEEYTPWFPIALKRIFPDKM